MSTEKRYSSVSYEADDLKKGQVFSVGRVDDPKKQNDDYSNLREDSYAISGRGMGKVVTPQPVYGNTMKFNALTYDDEVSRPDLNNHVSSNKRKSEAVVTDDSDNSEPDDIASSKKRSKSPPGKQKETDFVVYRGRTVSNKVASSKNYPKDEFGLGHSLLTSLTDKLLRGLGLSKRRDYNFHQLSATLFCFCMSNHPLDPELGCKIDFLLNSCIPLHEEFQRYREALSPGASSNSYIYNQNPENRDLQKSCSFYAMRDFKVFAVNCMENLLSENNHCVKHEMLKNPVLSEEEASLLKICTEVWCRNIAVQT